MILLLLACTSPSSKPADDSSAPSESAADSKLDSDSNSDSSADSAEDSQDSEPPEGNLPPSADECGGSFPVVDPGGPTIPQGAGPYWREDTPERSALNVWEEEGSRLILSMRVLDMEGNPLVGKRVTVWAVGLDTRYDFEGSEANGYGYQTSDAEGRVCVSMNRPAPYFNGNGGLNPAHIHLSVGDDEIELNQNLFTQFYFADDEWLTDFIPPELTFTPEILATGERIRTDLVLR